MDLCWQSNASAFYYAVYVGHNFSSKEQESFDFMAAVTICSDFGAQKNKVCHCFHCFSICHEVMGPDVMILVFWMLSFKQTFSLSSFTFIKRFFSSSLLSAIRVVSSAYLRLLIFLPAILIPAYASSAYKLNKPGDNIQPWRTPQYCLEANKILSFQSSLKLYNLLSQEWSLVFYFPSQILLDFSTPVPPKMEST